jgi:excisionase family DNA binding protein
MENLLDVHQVAELLSVSRWTVERWKALRLIPFVRLGRRTLFDPEDLREFIQAHRIPAKPTE